jgi:hypothetical protein
MGYTPRECPPHLSMQQERIDPRPGMRAIDERWNQENRGPPGAGGAQGEQEEPSLRSHTFFRRQREIQSESYGR